MPSAPNPPRSPAAALPLASALDRSQPLARLLQRLNASRECFAAVCDRLPEPLRGQVRPGPLDERGWTLLVANGAAAAKLRQLLPALRAHLNDRGLDVAEIRVRIHAG